MLAGKPIGGVFRIVGSVMALGCLSPAVAHAVTMSWLEYRAVGGCPGRDDFEIELQKRVNGQLLTAPDQLLVDVRFDGTAYEGQVRLQGGEGTTERLVRNESCAQVVSAIAFIAVLLLETERPNTLNEAKAATPSGVEPSRVLSEPGDEKARDVTAPAPTQFSEGELRRSKVGSSRYSWGPWLSLTAERGALPTLEVGARMGVFVGINGLWPRTQELLRLSATQMKSDLLDFDGRAANFKWIAVRLDLCHAVSNVEFSTLGVCAFAELGRLSGYGHVGDARFERTVDGFRLGAMVYLRQWVIGPLALSLDLGLVVPLTRPEFYFSGTSTGPEVSVFQPNTVGQVADVAFELSF